MYCLCVYILYAVRVYGTVYYIRVAMRARYLPRIGTVRYRYIPVLGMLYTVLYTVGKLYTVLIRRESDAALDVTAAVQGK